jgi:hypothetical protein
MTFNALNFLSCRVDLCKENKALLVDNSNITVQEINAVSSTVLMEMKFGRKKRAT